jgi:hypothetical protein
MKISSIKIPIASSGLDLQILPFFITEERCGFTEGCATDRLRHWNVEISMDVHII